MTITRRELLQGIAAAILIPAIPALSQTESRPFLYSLDDVLDTRNDPAQFRKTYLDTLPGTTLVYVWAINCYPCLYGLPKYNTLSERYKTKVTFISALAEDVVQENTDYSLGKYIDKSLERRYHGEYGIRRIRRLREDFNDGPPYDPELEEIIKKSQEVLQERKQTTAPKTYRKELGETIQILQREKHWPSFPTYFLDDQTTWNFLYPGKLNQTVPHFVLLQDGKAKRNIPRERLAEELRTLGW